jgi:hypothetical protein
MIGHRGVTRRTAAAGSLEALRMIPLAIAVTLLAAPSSAQSPADGTSVIEAAETLKPGEYLWAPDVAPRGPLLLIASLATQRMILYRNGIPIAISTISTGNTGHRTPTGIFTILQREVEHYSSIYDHAPMPYMQRLTWGGIALHGGTLPGYPASHGCIRLPHEFARRLYGVTRLGMTVVVTNEAVLPRIAPGNAVQWDDKVGVPSELEWHPERAPSGPVSVVISAADARVVVLRNGVAIGTASVRIDGKVSGTSVFIRQDEADHSLLGSVSTCPTGSPRRSRTVWRDAFMSIRASGRSSNRCSNRAPTSSLPPTRCEPEPATSPFGSRGTRQIPSQTSVRFGPGASQISCRS